MFLSVLLQGHVVRKGLLMRYLGGLATQFGLFTHSMLGVLGLSLC